jgi:hypothetical protein
MLLESETLEETLYVRGLMLIAKCENKTHTRTHFAG